MKQATEPRPPPDDLVALIRLAVADAGKMDRDRYEPVSWHWHHPKIMDGECMICFAGAVIAGTLGWTSDTALRSLTETGEWKNALIALEEVRNANWHTLADRQEWLSTGEATEMSASMRYLAFGENEFENWLEFDYFLDWANEVADKIEELRAS